MRKTYFGGGCFWCTEAAFKMVRGVSTVTPGYAGCHEDVVPDYQKVSSGSSGCAEVVEAGYDPSVVSYNDLLTVFFASHDPTQLNRQGNDTGTQYRSIILYTTEEERDIAQKFIADLKAQGVRVVTDLGQLDTFYGAEQEHLDYYQRNRSAPYCQLVIEPKLQELQKQVAHLLRK